MDMHSEMKIYPCSDGEIQRVHLVRFEDWAELDFLRPDPSKRAFGCFAHIYRQYLVPAAPWAFGNLVMFRLPEDVQIPQALAARYCGKVSDPLTVAALSLRRGLAVLGEKALFRDAAVRQLWDVLTERDCIRIVRGKLPITTIIPVGAEAGFMTESAPNAKLKVNASFFIMDPFDCATAYDRVGAHFGLLVKEGVVDNPPLFSREALMVRNDGSVRIESPQLRDLRVRIGGKLYVNGENSRFYSRPNRAGTPPVRKGLIIIGRRVAAVCSGIIPIPASGFVLCPKEECRAKPGDTVTYEGMEDVRFGIQVGNSLLRDGIKTEKFISKFFNIRGLRRIAFPPSLYPLDFENARAARIALGADREGKPMVIWAEGAAKLGHVPGLDSCGASLADMARICEELGMVNGINLDGGGSAQLLLNNERMLQISDRNADFSESERPIPLGLVIR